jgi:hypothetical protein
MIFSELCLDWFYLFQLMPNIRLGAIHDGTGDSKSCPVANNFVMTGLPGTINLLNTFIFSACSIAQFKTSLLNISTR